MTIEIKDKKGETLVSELITEENFQKSPFNIIAPNYMIEVEKLDGGGYEVTNAMDGHGNNCMSLFREVSIHII